ncbi:unnamed protein product [Adineta ricciae]|uniref:G-protein coupled receptors family 1 profile domain-containing protein n=1 Tax=Adineta ricciae TaxID=249248 RepID=A0A815G149_ADIRI|nr:unnamed protein product [Adineta ricciae]
MLSVNNTTLVEDENSAFPTYETPLSRTIKFHCLLVFQILSILCSAIIFISFGRMRELRAKQHNHIVICLLVCNFLIISIELPVTLIYIHFGQLIPSSDKLCLYWIFTNYFLFTTSIWLTAVASIQRHILIFHAHLMNSHIKHYTPIILLPISLCIWYIVLIFFYSCEQHFDYTQPWCIGPCYTFQSVISTVDWIIGSFVPVILTVHTNIVLVVRVVYQKYRMHRGRTWRTTRKLAFQLFSISFLFLSIYLPLIIISLIRLWFNPTFLMIFGILYISYAVYLVPLLIPFICLISLPEIVLQMNKFLCFNNYVEPERPQNIPMTISSRRINQ